MMLNADKLRGSCYLDKRVFPLHFFSDETNPGTIFNSLHNDDLVWVSKIDLGLLSGSVRGLQDKSIHLLFHFET